MKHSIIILFGLVLFEACVHSNQTTTMNPLPDSLSYEMILRTQSDQDCDPQNPNCTFIQFEYPLFINAEAPLNDSLNALQQLLFTNNSNSDSAIDSIMNGFLKSYTDFKHNYPDSKINWTANQSLVVQKQTRKWITLAYSEDFFTGGAHPNSLTKYFVIDKRTGKKLNLSDFFDSTAIQKLTTIGEPIFCALKGINPNTGLEEAGYNFPNNHFSLNNNFYFSDSGITFYYNRYEIGPYVMGATELTIPAAKITRLLKP
ncbi:MAG: DUF3298 and DUF4163 domain-containing protein [Bacteroidia bacterium]|jgi:hypothetical protein|nr:DUF3298 and DUF4163 domain-containing protein [Bacteroidia bacterium]